MSVAHGQMEFGIKCPECGATDFQKSSDDADADVTCKACGYRVGTYGEVKEAMQNVARKAKQAALAGAKKAWKKR